MTAHWLKHALEYAALGWRVFPLHGIKDGACTCGDPECRSPGKHPLTAGGVYDGTCEPEALKAWAERWPISNLGLALQDGLVAIDTDPRNGGDHTMEQIIAEHGELPDTVLALTGGGGTHHIFWNHDNRPLPGKLGKGIDIKSTGGYIVVEPSKHLSGAGYCWEAEGDPLEGAKVARLPDWIKREETPVATGAPLASSAVLSTSEALEIRSALAYLDPDGRDEWLAVGMSLHSTGAGNQAYGLWTEWAQQSDKFDAKDQRRVWNSFKPGHGRTKASLFAEAQAAGWVNPMSQQATAFSGAVQQAIEKANKRVHVQLVEPSEVDDADPADPGAIPVPALAAIGDWIDARYPVTHPDVTRQTVLALAALVASRVYVGEGNTPAHLCLGIVADSTMVTAYAKDSIARILDDCGLRRMMRGTRAGAPSNVYATLLRSPACIHVIPDYGHLAGFAQRQPSGLIDQAFGVMAEAYSAQSIYLDSAMDAGLKAGTNDDQLVIHNPALTTLLLSTQAQIGQLLQRKEITRGLLAHQLPVIVSNEGVVENEATSEAVPSWVREAVLGVRRLPKTPGDLSIQQIFGQQSFQRPSLIKVRLAGDWKPYADRIASLSAEIHHRPLVMAAQSTARRMMTVLGAWASPSAPVATVEIMEWVTLYVCRLLAIWLNEYATMGNEGTPDVAQHVVRAVSDRKGKGLPRSQLHMYCRQFRMVRDKAKREAILATLIEDEDLVEITPKGRRQKILIAARYAKKSEVGADSQVLAFPTTEGAKKRKT